MTGPLAPVFDQADVLLDDVGQNPDDGKVGHD